MIELLTPVKILSIDSAFYNEQMIVIDVIKPYPHIKEYLYRCQFPGDLSFKPIYKEDELEVVESKDC